MSTGTIPQDLGRRVELVSMDRHFHDISIGLYLRETEDGPVATIRSFSGRPGVKERLDFVASAMAELGGLERLPDGLSLRFTCGEWHELAAKRLFTEACKQDPSEPIASRPLEAPDTRTEQKIKVEPLGGGAYEVHADNVAEGETSRAPGIARAIAKLAGLERNEGERPVIRFSCGSEHDPLIGLLLVRAQNLRAVLREEEMKSSRGVLTAPSAQE